MKLRKLGRFSLTALASLAAIPALLADVRHASFLLDPDDAHRDGLRVPARGGLELVDARSSGTARFTLDGLPRGALALALDLDGAVGEWRASVACDGRDHELPRDGGTVGCVSDGRIGVLLSGRARGLGRVRLAAAALAVRWSVAPVPADPAALTARVHAPLPPVVERAAWGALEPRDPYVPHVPEAIVVHHSWTPDVAAYFGRGGAESVAGIQRFHMYDRERLWADVGYHFLIGPDGNVFRGRPTEVVGAHAVPNTGKVGICLIGNHDPEGDPVSPAAWASLVELVAALAHRYDVPMGEALHGHREFSTKSCPGDLVYERFSELRDAVRGRIGSTGEPRS